MDQLKTLADLQRGQPASGQPTGLPLHVEATRTFDTPEFRGMTFLEVAAKTALNRVRGMPFAWSINPYRGCSHACAYCLAGETPILMADGRTKALADVRVGDAIYGTERRGAYRRYVTTRVLAHWSTVKPAYRILLADGTRLIASGDHRFLTERGWKHVTGADHGPGRRPYLTTRNKLIGTGAFAEPAKHDPGYRRGYVCGMVRGDGHLGVYRYERTGRRHGDVYRFRLALADGEALERTRRYLLGFQVPLHAFLFSPGSPTRKPMHGLRTSKAADVEAIQNLVKWPSEVSEGWSAGFLAGIFDAEGSYHGGILRIHNTDETILGHVEGALRRLGFPFVREPARANGCAAIRITGGLRVHLRFFHIVDPSITRKRTIEGQALKSSAPLHVVAVEPLGFALPLYDITTGTGDFIANGVVSHNCFARPTHRYLNLSPLEDFERTVVVKTNVVEVLRRELAKPSWKGDRVAMGTNTDPYQRCEGRYRLMPGIISALGDSRTPFSILTKGTLITRDLPVLAEAAEKIEVTAALTIGMLDETLWREVEPGTPSPAARIDAVRALTEAGIPTGVMLAPIMPGLNDDPAQLGELVDHCVAAGATHVSPIVLHLRPGVKELFMPWLAAHHPGLLARYQNMYRGSQTPAAYREEISAVVGPARKAALRRHGRPAGPPARRFASPAEAAPAITEAETGSQLPLF